MPGNDGPYAGLPNKVVEAANGASYAYRDTGGEGEVPLVAFLTTMDLGQVDLLGFSAHGFLFQHHAGFAADVEAFLSDPR